MGEEGAADGGTQKEGAPPPVAEITTNAQNSNPSRSKSDGRLMQRSQVKTQILNPLGTKGSVAPSQLKRATTEPHQKKSIQVQIPPDTDPHGEFTVKVDGNSLQVPVPPNAKPGDMIVLHLDEYTLSKEEQDKVDHQKEFDLWKQGHGTLNRFESSSGNFEDSAFTEDSNLDVQALLNQPVPGGEEPNSDEDQNGDAKDATETDGKKEGDGKPKEDKKKRHRKKKDLVAVFNANTPEGGSIVRSLAAKKEYNVVAIVRVITSKNAKRLLRLPRVSVKVADSRHDSDGLAKAIRGADRCFLVTQFWEKFENAMEERQALTVLEACDKAGVEHLVFSTFEDTKQLRERKEKSQIVPDAEGTVTPKFRGMKNVRKLAKGLGIRTTHMITSYLDQETSRKSICLIQGEGNLIITPHFEE